MVSWVWWSRLGWFGLGNKGNNIKASNRNGRVAGTERNGALTFVIILVLELGNSHPVPGGDVPSVDGRVAVGGLEDSGGGKPCTSGARSELLRSSNPVVLEGEGKRVVLALVSLGNLGEVQLREADQPLDEGDHAGNLFGDVVRLDSADD